MATFGRFFRMMPAETYPICVMITGAVCIGATVATRQLGSNPEITAIKSNALAFAQPTTTYQKVLPKSSIYPDSPYFRKDDMRTKLYQ